MAFLTDADYAALVDEDDLAALTDHTNANVRAIAEAAAQEEVAGYLRGRFDVAAAYAATGGARNAQLVQAVADVALWNLAPRVALRNVSEIRETRYKATMAWCKQVATAQNNPALPAYAPNAAQPQQHRLFRWGSDAARTQSF
jgi:hypothetical protein